MVAADELADAKENDVGRISVARTDTKAADVKLKIGGVTRVSENCDKVAST